MAPDNIFPPLPSEKRRRVKQAEDEVLVGPLWNDGCPIAVGRKLLALLPHLTNGSDRVLKRVSDHMHINNATGSVGRLPRHSLEGQGDEQMRLDVTAATYYAFKWLQVNDEQPIVIDIYGAERAWYDTDKLTEALNNLLLFERVDWEIAGGEFVRRGNSILHAEVVQPALTLLANSPQFNVASEGFQSALNSLSHNREGEAVTMAATSLQEFFRGLGANGNSLPDQLNEAQKKGVITKADRSLLKPLVDWMNADRSDHGTAHKVTNGAVTRDDAWLMLHVAAALMVRLSNGEPRM